MKQAVKHAGDRNLLHSSTIQQSSIFDARITKTEIEPFRYAVHLAVKY